jgi:chemotaxis protein MotA
VDIATIVGIIGGVVLIVVSILLGSPLTAFLNIPGLMIVVGGTIMATLIMQKLNVVLSAFNVAMNAFFDKTVPPDRLIKQIVDLAVKVRKGGLLALEKEKIKHPFLARAVRMAVDGVEPQEIIQTLKIEIDSMVERHESGQKIFRFMGSTSPAMGMIGTLIGLVQMLRTMNDPSTIGPAMAVALLTTFYGALMAFLIFNPIADKLEERTKEEKFNMEIILAGIDGIIKGINHLILQDKLIAFLPSKKRKLGK